jgi:hypothetical protein
MELKMSDSSPFLILEQPCDDAIDWVARQIGNAGLQVVRTFDLHVARRAQTSCPCPHHGTDQCDCQMVVLLVYGSDRQPVSIVAHGHNGQTWFSVVDTPQQRADPRVETAIRLALVPHVAATLLNQASQSHAT